MLGDNKQELLLDAKQRLVSPHKSWLIPSVLQDASDPIDTVAKRSGSVLPGGGFNSDSLSHANTMQLPRRAAHCLLKRLARSVRRLPLNEQEI